MDNFPTVRFKSDKNNVVRLWQALRTKLHERYDVVIEDDDVIVTPPVSVIKRQAA